MDTRKNKNSSQFDSIYRKAEALEEYDLKNEISGYACLNVTDNIGLFTPVAKLAANAQHKAVALMLKLGASESQAAMGYASVGDTERAEQIRKNHFINIKLLAIGAAMHADTSYAELLRKKFHLNPAWFVYGAAIVGNFKYIESLFQTTLSSKQKETAICMQIKGLILGGHVKNALDVLEKNTNPHCDLFLQVAIEAAGRAGLLFHVGEVDAKQGEVQKALLFRSSTVQARLNQYRCIAAKGAAKGGNIELARSLYMQTDKTHAQQEAIILAAMTHGHVTSTMQRFPCPAGLSLNNDEFLNHPITLKAAAFGCHQDLSDKIVSKKPEAMFVTEVAELGDLETAQKLNALNRVNLEDIIERMQSDKYFQSEDVLLYTLTMMHLNVNDNAFADDLARRASELKSDETIKRQTTTKHFEKTFKKDFFYQFKEINTRAKKIKETMKRLDVNYDQAKAWIECDVTITANSLLSLKANDKKFGSSPVLEVLAWNPGYKFKDKKKEAVFKHAAELITPLMQSLLYYKDKDSGDIQERDLNNITFMSPDTPFIDIKLHDLIVKMAFNGFEGVAISRDLSLLTGLNEKDAGDLYEKFCLKVSKSHTYAMLDGYLNYNYWEFYKFGHIGRAKSLKDEIEHPSDPGMDKHTRASILGVFKITKGLFEKSLTPSNVPGISKWQQPLNNTSKDDKLYEVAKKVTNSRLTNK